MRWLFIIFILFCFSAFAEDSVKQTADYVKQTASSSDMVWNKWDTDNFIILSIDKSQGLYLKHNIESIKDDFEKRWGIKNIKFEVPCKLLCVPDENMLTRFFNINEPRAETRRDSEGKIATSSIWIDFKYSNDLSYLVAPIILDNSDNLFFIKKGVSKLEESLSNIRSDLKQFSPIDFKKIIMTTEDSFYKMSLEEKNKFIKSSAVACLLLRKEFGIKKFSQFISSKQSESDMKSIFGFENLDAFSNTLNRYSKNLSEDILNNKTPDYYLKSK